jgi:hypothetical protein
MELQMPKAFKQANKKLKRRQNTNISQLIEGDHLK